MADYGNTSVLGEVSMISYRNSAWHTLYVKETGSSATNAVLVEGTKPVIFNAGNVGINTTSPQYKLDVNGNLRVEKAVLNYGEALSIAPGTISIETVPTGTFNGAFFDYIGISGSNSRIGTVGAVWIDSFVDYNDTPTAELGSTTDLSLSVTLVGGNVEFRATTTTDGWDVKTLIRFI